MAGIERPPLVRTKMGKGSRAVARGSLPAACGVLAGMLGTGFATGRDIAAFYAQTGAASWIGIGLSAVLLGLFADMIVRLKRRTGAESFPQIYGRLYGGGGRAIGVLHNMLLIFEAAILIASAARLGALCLNIKGAETIGAALVLILSAVTAAGGMPRLERTGAVCLAALLLTCLALLLFGKTPGHAGQVVQTELLLENSLTASILLAALHAALCASLTATLMTASADARNSPEGFGACVAGGFFLMTAAGNLVLRTQPGELLRLSLPFVALASEWGGFGFYWMAGIIALCIVTTLAGTLISLKRSPVRRGTRAAMLSAAAGACVLLAREADAVALFWAALVWSCAAVAGLFMCGQEKRRRTERKMREPGC